MHSSCYSYLPNPFFLLSFNLSSKILKLKGDTKTNSMPSAPSFPSAAESEVADTLLLLSKTQVSVWGSKKWRSIRYKTQSGSKITIKDESQNKIVPRAPSPKSPLSFNSITDNRQPSLSEVSPSEKLPMDVSSRSTSAKRRGMKLKEQIERVAVLVRDNLTLQKTRFEVKMRYLILKERNASLKRMKRGLILNRQFWSQIPMGNVADMEATRGRIQFVTAAEGRRPWREGCAAARKRRMELMRMKDGGKRQRLR